MKIGLISDTHGNLAGWLAAWNLVLHDADLIIHCGDLFYHGPKFQQAPGYDVPALAAEFNACPVPLLIAQGNADSEVDQLVLTPPLQSPYLLVQMEGVRLLASHGHRFGPEQLLELGESWALDYVITGHTHAPCHRQRGGVMHLNPGTPTYPLSPNPHLRRKSCAALVDGEPRWWDLEAGEDFAVPREDL